MTIRDLRTHPASYVSVGELAEYWDISRERVYHHIENGALVAVRLGPRSYRIRREHALEFEERMSSLQPKAAEAGDSSTRPPGGRKRPDDPEGV